MDKRATCRKTLRKTALSVLAASILMTGMGDAVRAEETPNVLQTVEAESGTLLGKAKIAATGTCVSGLEHTGDGVEVTVTVPEDGLYDIIVRTAVIGGGTKVNEVNANGQHVGDITNSGSWSDEVVPYVWLEAGDNTVSVTTSYGWIAVDSFSIRRAAPLPADVYEVKPTLINPNATDSAKRLMTYLCDQYGKTRLSIFSSACIICCIFSFPFGVSEKNICRLSSLLMFLRINPLFSTEVITFETREFERPI